MKAKFTKAPWLHNGNDCDWSLYDEKEEGIVAASYLGQIEVSNVADMDLIAAAPDLYSVLAKIVNSGAWYYSALEIDTYESGYDGEQLKQMALDVLAKARGE